jgi:hypothetical protein
VQSWQKQPEEKAVVWQHNRLAEARYELTAREQKLLLYVIAMIEPEDEDFKRYIINVAEFAHLANLDKDHLYRELRELAKSLKQKPLIIPNHFDAQTRTYLDLVTSWFDTAYVGRNGAGYFAVTISPNCQSPDTGGICSGRTGFTAAIPRRGEAQRVAPFLPRARMHVAQILEGLRNAGIRASVD